MSVQQCLLSNLDDMNGGKHYVLTKGYRIQTRTADASIVGVETQIKPFRRSYSLLAQSRIVLSTSVLRLKCRLLYLHECACTGKRGIFFYEGQLMYLRSSYIRCFLKTAEAIENAAWDPGIPGIGLLTGKPLVCLRYVVGTTNMVFAHVVLQQDVLHSAPYWC